MATTTNYGWTKPTVGGNSNTWGDEINTDLDGIDSTVKAVSDVANAALPKAGGTMTGALTNASGFVGPLTGNASGSSGSCTGNAATASTANTVSDAAITPAKMSAGHPTWDGSGNVTVNGQLVVEGSQPGAPNFNLRIESGFIILQLGATAGVSWDSGTGKLFLVNGSQNVASIDGSGNMILKGTLTQNGTP